MLGRFRIARRICFYDVRQVQNRAKDLFLSCYVGLEQQDLFILMQINFMNINLEFCRKNSTIFSQIFMQKLDSSFNQYKNFNDFTLIDTSTVFFLAKTVLSGWFGYIFYLDPDLQHFVEFNFLFCERGTIRLILQIVMSFCFVKKALTTLLIIMTIKHP